MSQDTQPIDRWSCSHTDTCTYRHSLLSLCQTHEHTSQTNSQRAHFAYVRVYEAAPGASSRRFVVGSGAEAYRRCEMTWGGREGREAEKTDEEKRLKFRQQTVTAETALHFWECELCDRKSHGFVWITVTAGLSYCKNRHHQKTPAAFLISVGLLTKTFSRRTPHVCKPGR